jgi:CelD/BcsL family acetyltransferase involved in cellulose biosynthesis
MNAHSPFVAAAIVDAERVEIVTSASRLMEIGPAWQALWEQLDGLVFQSHAWIEAWWSTIPDRESRALRIGLVWQGDRLVAVAPLAIARRRGLRLLEWTAAGYTDYGDILRAPECSALALEELWRTIRRSGGFDLIMLNRLLPDAAARRLVSLSGGRSSLALHHHHRQEASFRVAGPFTTGAGWLESQSKKTRQNYRRGYKELETAGPVRFRLLSPEEDLEPVLARVAELKRRWLEKQARQSDLFAASGTTLPALVAALHKSGILRVFVLECGGAAIAVSINFVQHDTMMAFITTYDPRFERASPGMLLMVDYIGWSIDNGLKLVDFLCGAEPFKLRFANQSVILGTVVAARTPLGHAALAVDRLREAYRRRRDKAKSAKATTPAEDPA